MLLTVCMYHGRFISTTCINLSEIFFLVFEGMIDYALRPTAISGTFFTFLYPISSVPSQPKEDYYDCAVNHNAVSSNSSCIDFVHLV